MKALILAAGEGSRFAKAGYTFPKPLIDVGDGRPMIQMVVDTLPRCGEYIFCFRKEHVEKYNLDSLVSSITEGCGKIVVVDKLTEGAACTALLAHDLIRGNEPLLIANSDQYCKYNKINFNVLSQMTEVDGLIFTFNSNHPKWSYVELDRNFRVRYVAEKDPISNHATVGLYYFDSANLFIEAAQSMITKDIRTNGEFYLAPCYNEIVNDYDIYPFFVDEMFGTGTPEDLDVYKSR